MIETERRSRFFLYNLRSYWKLRAWSLRKIKTFQLFRLEKQQTLAEGRHSIWIIIQIVRSILSVLVFSIILFIIVEKLDYEAIQAFKWLAHQLRLDVSSFSSKLDPNYIASFVGTVAQIAGIFLGLYYTAVGVVVSTAYAKFPNQLRQLLLSERIGNLYIKSTTLLATWAVLTLALLGVGYETGRLSYFLICFLSVLSVLSFVKFGVHAFNLYDLRSILYEPYQSLITAIRRVSIVTGYGTDSIHEKSRYDAQGVLQIFEDVLSVSSNSKFDRERIIQALLSYLLSGLTVYAETKGRISSKSKWFPISNQHRSWLTADASYIATSLHTGTPLHPLQSTEFSWYEDRSHEIIKKAFRVLLESEETSGCVRALLMASNAASRLTENHAVAESIQLVKAITSTIDEYISGHPLIVSDHKGVSLPAHLAQVEAMHCLLYTELPIAFGKSVRKLTFGDISDVAAQMHSSKGKNRSYGKVLPRALLDETNRLSDLIIFEHKAEGRVVTEKWYLEQILGLAATRHINKSLQDLHQAFDGFYCSQPKRKVAGPYVEYRCHRMIAAVEAFEKFIVHLDFSKVTFESLKKARKATDIPFEEIDFESLYKSISTLRSKVIDELALNALLIGYGAKSRDPETPDFFGQAYFLCLEECRSALKSGDETRFKAVFPTTFGLAWFAYGSVEEELKGQSDKIRIIYTTEVLEEIMSLSGFAYIYAHLDGKTFSTTIEEVWNKHFEAVPNKGAFAKYLLACISYRKSEFGLMPRAIIRTGWDQELSHELRRRGLLDDDFSYRRYRREEGEEKKHPSKLIRAISRSSFSVHSTIEVFACLYLLGSSEAIEKDIPQSVKAVRESLEREDDHED